MSGVKRVFVEKKKPFAVNAKELLEEIGGYLGIKTITDVRVLIRYDIENLSEETYKKALTKTGIQKNLHIRMNSRITFSDYLDFIFDIFQKSHHYHPCFLSKQKREQTHQETNLSAVPLY